MVDRLHAAATAALQSGDWLAAQALATRMLDMSPGPAAYYVAGVASLRLHQLLPAIEYLRRAALLDPTWCECLVELSRAHLTLGNVQIAVGMADHAMTMSPQTGATLDTLGVIYGQAQLHDKAKLAFQRAVEHAPDSAASRFNFASTLAFSGDIDAAEREFEACLRLDPRFWRAWLFLSQIRRQTPEKNHTQALRTALEANAQQAQAQLYLNVALAKELEDLGRYDEAFDCLTRGKAAGGAGRGYTIERDAAMIETIIRCFPDGLHHADGCDSTAPIFIIGMPRSGTTLVERIVSSHPLVHPVGELRSFLVALERATAGPPGFVLDPDFPERVAQVDWQRLGRDYLDSVQHLVGAEPHFVDKLPHNFLYAGFIARALPRARIICLRRDPVDTCLSNFKQVFALNSPYFDYSFDLLDTGRYYLLFDRLMAHWQSVLPGRILEVQYEDLVRDQESNTRRLLEFCGLPWDEACLHFETNPNPVATASVVQVRVPMHQASVGRWKHYETQLAPLLRVLADGGVID